MSTALKNGVSSDAEFSERLAHVAEATEFLLAQLITQALVEGERMRPERLIAAMRHAALGGGKRLRPFLATASRRVAGPRYRATNGCATVS